MISNLRKTLLLAVLTPFCQFLHAQTILVKPVNIQQAYTKGTRSDDGKPGKNYWQNTANYNIKVNFDPQTRNVGGTVEIDYVNNSPDTLKQIWFKLYPNLYKKGTPRMSNIAAEDLSDGVQISRLKIGNNNINVNDKRALAINSTNMTVPGQLVMPHQSVHISVDYSYILNKGSHTRTGQVDDGSYFVAYFFPRVAVYDDIDGWNTIPYTGPQEFYNDFCHFKAEVTLPGDYVVWATGNLTNPKEVFNSKIANRIALAEKQDSVTNVITEADVNAGNVTTKADKHTWKFEADSVTDFVFATSNHYIWQASSLVVDPKTGRRTRVDAAFNPKHKSFFNVIGYARKTVEAMSYKFIKWPYPYAHETVFDGLDQMEYPMMVNDNPLEDTADDIELTDHEIFHTMFPFYMGINETKYGWMDEGWATIGEWLISPMIDPTIKDGYGVEAYAHVAGREDDVPIMTLTTQLAGSAEFTDPYPKPAMGYLYVKDMLGDELFTKAMHHYISLWHGKHPGPFDFFNAINEGSGRNFNWFWQRWYFERGVPDLAISSVSHVGNAYKATITSVGTKPVPINLTLNYADGTSKVIYKDVSVWEKGNKTYVVNFTAEKQVKTIELGELHIPDSNKKNNVWEVKN